MKMISNFTENTIQTQDFDLQLNQNEIYTDFETSDDSIDGLNLLRHINHQFDLVYKENKKRKYLLKEVSGYLLQK